MTTQKQISRTREILRLNSLGISQRQIAISCDCSRNTVQDVLLRSSLVGVTWPLPDDLDDANLMAIIYPTVKQQNQSNKGKSVPDYLEIHHELAKKGVNMKLLWTEYVQTCKENGKDYLQYAQFCVRYRQYAQQTKATMHMHHKPGEKCEVDWAGTTYDMWDKETGEAIPVYLFVGVLTSSKFTFAKGYPNTKLSCWLSAHADMLNYFKGVPLIIIPDNCRTAVIKNSKYTEPVLNKSYQEMAEHYGFAVIPARPYRPKDKPTTEKSVSIATTWVLAALRNKLFFNIGDLNAAIADKLEELNDKPFQKLSGSRRSAFLGEEAAALQPLPQTPYELAIWKTAKVNLSYCVEVDKSFYSVPYQYINYKVDVRLTTRVLEVYYQGQRICSHPRHYGRPGHYETNPEHMPANHQAHLTWDGDRFRKWAGKIGKYTRMVIDHLLSSRVHEQQAYRACMSLLKFSDQYTAIRLESACERAIALHYPSYKVVKNILESGQDRMPSPNGPSTDPQTGKTHRNVRGHNYYAQLAQDMQERQIPLDSLKDNMED